MAEEIKKKRGRPKGLKNKPKKAKVNAAVVYNVFCRKCGSDFQSTDERDTDGDGLCSECKEKAKVIATNVQKIIDQRRASRSPTPPRRTSEPPTMPGSDYINWKNIM